MKLDKNKIEEALLRNGFSTKRSKVLADLLAKEDLLKKEEIKKEEIKKEKKLIKTINISEVNKEE